MNRIYIRIKVFCGRCCRSPRDRCGRVIVVGADLSGTRRGRAPSPAQDYFDGRIDLNEHLIKDITSTYIVRVSGESMEGTGISDGDELIVNRALEPVDGSVVVAVLDGELTIKRLRITGTGVVLQAENPVYPDIRVPSLSDLVIWGVATRCLHHV
jgi:DNA polymerase V